MAAVVGNDQARRFLHTFIEMWPCRRARIHQAVLRRDPHAAQDAALSLKSGAAMAGALELSDHANRLHESVSTYGSEGRWEACARLLEELDALGTRTVEELVHLAGQSEAFA